MSETTEDGLWDAGDVARVLKLSPASVRQKSARGEIPFRWVLGLRRYVPAEIRALAGLPSPADGGRAA